MMIVMADEVGPVARVFESPGVMVLGGLADAAAVVVLLNVEALKGWVSNNPVFMILIAAILLLLVIVLFDRWRALRATIKRLERRLQGASPHDIKRFGTFIDDFGPETPYYSWLHEGFAGNSIRGRELDTSIRLESKWSKDPSNYLDPEVAKEFTHVKNALIKFNEVMSSNFFSDARDDDRDEALHRYSIPTGWEYGKRDEAVTKIHLAYKSLMERYAKFYQLATSKGMGPQ